MSCDHDADEEKAGAPTDGHDDDGDADGDDNERKGGPESPIDVQASMSVRYVPLCHHYRGYHHRHFLQALLLPLVLLLLSR